jgi:integrase
MEARRLRDEFRREVRSGRKLPSGAEARATFAAVAEDWLERQRQLERVGELAPTTLAGYERAVRLHLVPVLGARRMSSIGPDDLVEWHARQRAAGGATWSIKGRWTALRLILAFAARRGHLETNPADLLERRERPSAGDPKQRFLSDDEMPRLLAASTQRYRPLVAVCLFAGLRISEAVGLTWQDVDFGAELIRVRHQLSREAGSKRRKIKTPAGRRDVVMMDALARELRRHKLSARFSRDADPVFATDSGRPLSQRNASREFAKAVDRAKLEGVSFHALRHTFASLLIAQGRDPVFVADQLGHASPSITLRVYSHLFRAARQAREARDALEADYGHLLGGRS